MTTKPRYLSPRQMVELGIGPGRKVEDITGRRFGRLKVLGCAGLRRPTHGTWWRCQCDCGKEVTVHRPNLGRSTKSCGCLNREIASAKSKRVQLHRRVALREAICMWRYGPWSDDDFYTFLNNYVTIHPRDRRKAKEANHVQQDGQKQLRDVGVQQAGRAGRADVQASLGDAAQAHAGCVATREGVL